MFTGIAGDEQRIALTLYTDAYVIRGQVNTRQRRVTDILNQADAEFIVLTDVMLDEFGTRSVATRADYAQINLGSVLFAVAESTVETVPELRTPKVQEEALISVPPFKVIGRIHLLPERDLRMALEELTGRFVPVTEAAYWSDIVGEARTTASLLAFNHSRAQILAPHREVDPWEGLNRGPVEVPADGASESVLIGDTQGGTAVQDPWAQAPPTPAAQGGGQDPWGEGSPTSQPAGGQDPWRDERRS
jgi:hypothetical protein